MSLDYNKVWKSMNDLNEISSKIPIIINTIDSSIDYIQKGDCSRSEHLMLAAIEILQDYLDKFDSKFKVAWEQTVTELKKELDKNNSSFLKDWEMFFYPEEVKKEETMPPWGHSDMEALRYTDEELNAMCDNAEKQEVKKWTLPVEIDGASGEYFLTLPDDLLDKLSWSEGDSLEWVDNKDGTLSLRKYSQQISPWDC